MEKIKENNSRFAAQFIAFPFACNLIDIANKVQSLKIICTVKKQIKFIVVLETKLQGLIKTDQAKCLGPTRNKGHTKVKKREKGPTKVKN